MTKIYPSEVGLKIEVTILDVNLTGATVIYNINDPSGNNTTKTATIDDPIHGVTSYTTTSSEDFKTPGNYLIQPKVSINGSVFYAETIDILISDLYQ